jgi:hypothetical protein
MKTISCKEAVKSILKKEEGNLSLPERLSLWRHLAICSLCRIFSIQNKKINRGLTLRKKKQFSLTDEEKHSIINRVLDDKKDQEHI